MADDQQKEYMLEQQKALAQEQAIRSVQQKKADVAMEVS